MSHNPPSLDLQLWRHKRKTRHPPSAKHFFSTSAKMVFQGAKHRLVDFQKSTFGGEGSGWGLWVTCNPVTVILLSVCGPSSIHSSGNTELQQCLQHIFSNFFCHPFFELTHSNCFISGCVKDVCDFQVQIFPDPRWCLWGWQGQTKNGKQIVNWIDFSRFFCSFFFFFFFSLSLFCTVFCFLVCLLLFF